MKQDTQIAIGVAALVGALVYLNRDKTPNAAARVFDVEDDLFTIPSAVPTATPFPLAGTVPLPTSSPRELFIQPAAVDAFDAFDAHAELGFENDDFAGVGDFWTSIDVVELGVEAGKSVTRTVVGAIDPLAAITRLLPGVPTVGPLLTPVDAILDLF